MRRDFTLGVYENLCKALILNNSKITTVKKFLEEEESPGKKVILRHDIDNFPLQALKHG